MNINLKHLGQSLGAQFQGLAGRPPALWPLAPRVLCGVGVMVAICVAGYFAYWSTQFEEHERLAAEEVTLKDQYRIKMGQAINLEELKKQKVQVDMYVDRLQKQLPSKAEMASLLTDINQAGVGRGLTFDLFKPAGVIVRDYYAEQPIDIRLLGTYHDLGAFASDMANLPRIVTLNNMSLTTNKDGGLVLDAVAKTFRYLDQEEASAQRVLRLEREKKAREEKKGAAK